MKKLVAFITIVLLVNFSGILTSTYGQWTKNIIDPNITWSGFIRVADIEGDGDMDVFVKEYHGANVLLYENNNLTWTKHIVDAFIGGVGLDLADFDGDGQLDITIASWRADLVAWYKNEGGYPINWIRDTIDSALDGAEVVYAEDINGDGAPDAVAFGYLSNETVWYENNLPGEWTKNIIGSNIRGDGCIYVADINNDDRPDVVRAAPISNTVVLYKNNLPNTNWTEIIIDGNLPGAFMAHIADIDNDGDMDITATGQGSGGIAGEVAWYENDGSEQTWTKHTITADLLRARGLYLADIDSNDYPDVVVTDLGADDIILFMNEDGGQNWTEYMIDNDYDNPNTVFAYDIDLDNDFDILPAPRGDNAYVWYENHFGSAYAESLGASPFLIQSPGDTLTVTAKLSNPDNHPVNVFAFIQGDQTQFIDSVQLFDDGLHSDNDSSDNMWGNTMLSTGFPEDEFKVDLVSYDSTDDVTLGFLYPARFITLGRVAFEEYSFITDFFNDDTVPNPGDFLQLSLTLKNNSAIATATNIKVELLSLDTLVTFTNRISSYEDIPAGESSNSIGKYVISISEDCTAPKEIPIKVNISSYGQVCWSDTFSIFVDTTTTNITDVRIPLIKIYPNPGNDILTIETEYLGQQSLEITSLNGQLLYNDNIEGHTHQIDLSSFQKGVYLITIRSEDFVKTEKIIKL